MPQNDSYVPNVGLTKQLSGKIPHTLSVVDYNKRNAERLEYADGAVDTAVSTLVLCTVLGTLQDVLTPLWRKCFDGCCLNRDTVGLLEEEGFLIRELQSYYKGLAVTVVGTKS
jgi:hypothetical protein